MTTRVAIIGTGRLGEAILRALLERGGQHGDDVICTARRAERVTELEQRYGVGATTDNRAALADADIVILACKPQVLLPLLDDLGDAVTAPLVISVAAGIPTSAIESRIAARHVVRAMPNTPLLIGAGMTALAGGSAARDDDLAAAAQLFASAGRTVVVDEAAMDAVTAVSGSGPAYLFLLAEAMMAAASAEGLDDTAARDLVVQTLVGASLMLDADPDPVALRAQVTSPGGTTAAALEVFESRGLTAIVADAIAAARQRSRQLGGGHAGP